MDVSLMDVTGAGPTGRGRLAAQEKQGAAGITTAAPYVASQWGRGMTGCRENAEVSKIVPAAANFFRHG
jgi:hypothetical protein